MENPRADERRGERRYWEPKMRRIALSALIAAGAGSASSAAADTVVVNVFDFDFSTGGPSDPIVDPTINVGDTIRWEWINGFHSVVSVPGAIEPFDSEGNFVAPHTFEHTFATPGVHWYFCDLHGFPLPNGTAGGMAGTITVVPGPGVAGVLVVGAGVMAGRRRSRLARIE